MCTIDPYKDAVTMQLSVSLDLWKYIIHFWDSICKDYIVVEKSFKFNKLLNKQNRLLIQIREPSNVSSLTVAVQEYYNFDSWDNDWKIHYNDQIYSFKSVESAISFIKSNKWESN